MKAIWLPELTDIVDNDEFDIMNLPIVLEADSERLEPLIPSQMSSNLDAMDQTENWISDDSRERGLVP